MGYHKNENGCYEVYYSKRHPITRRPHNLRRTTFKKGNKRLLITSEAEARRVEHELVREIDAKFKKQIVKQWSCVLDEFIEHSKDNGLSIKTIENRRLCLNAYTRDKWGDKLITEISPLEIRSLINNDASSKSESHKKSLLKFIRLCFEFAVEAGYISRNPTPRMRIKIGDKVKKVLTTQQATTLLSQARDMKTEWYPHWAMALYTGMRNGELIALTWDKVNIDERQIIVDCSWDNKSGFKTTKSGDERIVEIAEPLVEVLKTLQESRIESCSFVLPRIDKWEKGDQARELRFFLEGLGLPRIRFHDLRATWATIMLGNGVPPVKVMKMGGWKDLKTMQIYTRMAGVDIKGITNDLILENRY